jgi:hypothetical protein
VKTRAVEPKREATVSSELQKCKSRKSQRSQKKFGEVGAVTQAFIWHFAQLFGNVVPLNAILALCISVMGC